MGELAGQEKALLDRIHELRLLRDAQDPDGNRRLLFQRQIEGLTDELVTLRAIAPRLGELDDELVAARARLARVCESVDDPWRPAAGFLGGVGGLLLGLALVFDLGSGWWVAACGLLVAAVGALSASVRYERDVCGEVDAARAEVTRVVGQRALLLGQRDMVRARVSQGLSQPGAVSRGDVSLPAGGDGTGRY